MTSAQQNASNRKTSNRDSRTGRRVAAGVLTAATVATVGVGQMLGQGQADAGLLDVLGLSGISDLTDNIDAVKSINSSQGSSLQELIAQISGGAVNNAATQTILDQWRIDACGTGGTSADGQANCSKATLTGIAIVLPGNVDLVPKVVYVPIQSVVNNALVQSLLSLVGITNGTIPNAAQPTGSATVSGSGFQFAVASTGGTAQAISYLPVSLATAGASDGRTAEAFAIIGMANAWTTDDVPVTLLGHDTGLDIPGIKSVSCYGGITAAYAEGVGACANIGGVSDFRLDLQQSTPEMQFALTDPSGILTDPSGVFSQVITQLLNGEPLSLSKDFTRFTVGGDHVDRQGNHVLFTLTSDYGTQGPITIHWLGSTVVLNPEVEVNGVWKPNHLGAPVFTFGTPTGASDLVPVIDLPEIEFPFGIPSIGPQTIGSTTQTGSTNTVTPNVLRVAAVPTAAVESPASQAAASDTPTTETPTTESPSVETSSTETSSIETSSTATSSAATPADADPSTTSTPAAGGKHELTETGRHHNGFTGAGTALTGKHAAPETGTSSAGTSSSGTQSSSSTGSTSTGSTSGAASGSAAA